MGIFEIIHPPKKTCKHKESFYVLGGGGGMARRIDDVNMFKLGAVPSTEFDVSLITRKLRGIMFSLLYDFKNMEILIITAEIHRKTIESILNTIIGLDFIHIGVPRHLALKDFWSCTAFPAKGQFIIDDPYATRTREREDSISMKPPPLEDLFSSLSGYDAKLLITFHPTTEEEVIKEIERCEKTISSSEMGIRSGVSLDIPAFMIPKMTSESKNRRLYKDTVRAAYTSERLTMLNKSLVTGDSVFRVVAVGFGEDKEIIKQQFYTKFPVYQLSLKQNEIDYLNYGLPINKGELISGEYAGRLILFTSEMAPENIVVDIPPLQQVFKEGVFLGNEMLKGVNTTERKIRFHKSAFNVHSEISGMQGMGKTTLATMIANYALEEKVGTIVLTPDNEWSRLGREKKDIIIVPFRKNPPINLVERPRDVPADIFYQNLSILLSSSAGAGPYTRPLRSVLLSAFTKLYKENPNPSLEEVYIAIDDAIEEMFGLVNWKTGEKTFDKYGQNLKSSLEAFRQILLKENYRVREGVRMDDCIKRGAVFDLSGVSDLIRPLIYAFLLSQIFSRVMVRFDEKGDMDPRLLIIVEEAHLVFREDRHYREGAEEATRELESRLGQLRKRGVGIMLITHFINQLAEGIRRHTQSRFVFKQDSIGAEDAVKDLAFDPSRDHQELAMTKLLKLKKFECASLLVNEDREVVGPFFMKIRPEFTESLSEDEIENNLERYLSTLSYSRVGEIKPSPETKPSLIDVSSFSIQLSPGPRQMLKVIGERGRINTSDLYNELKGSAKKFPAWRQELEELGLIGSEGIRTSRRGRSKKAYFLTSQGERVYADMFRKKPGTGMEKATRGGGEHTLLVDQTIGFFEGMGYERIDTSVDLRSKKGDLDIALKRGNETVLVEVDTGNNPNELLRTNLTKLMERRKKEIRKGNKTRQIWIANSKKTERKLRGVITEYYLDENDVDVELGTIDGLLADDLHKICKKAARTEKIV